MRRTSPPTLAMTSASASASRVAVPLYIASISPRVGTEISTGMAASALALSSFSLAVLSPATPSAEQALSARTSMRMPAERSFLSMARPLVDAFMTAHPPHWLRWGRSLGNYGVVVNYNTIPALGKRHGRTDSAYSAFLGSLFTVRTGAGVWGRTPETMSVMTSAA